MSSTYRLACCFALVCSAGAARVVPKSLKGADTQDKALLRQRVVDALQGVELHSGLGSAKAPQAGGSRADQPVSVQVDEAKLEKLHKKLSPQCSKRFSAMMSGDAPQMHTFKEHSDSPTNKQCDDLQGKICATEAAITENVNHHDGRNLEQRVEVSGNGCLPQECTAHDDLNALTTFMHAQTKEMMPDVGTEIEVSVDCRPSGGSMVEVGRKASVEPKQQKSATPALGLGLVVALLTCRAAL